MKLKNLLAFCILLLITSQVIGQVTATPFLADGNTPLVLADAGDPNQYRDIMVGTTLTIIVESDAPESMWSGKLVIEDNHISYGQLFYRDDSIYEAAGAWSFVDMEVGYWDGKVIEGFNLYTDEVNYAGR